MKTAEVNNYEQQREWKANERADEDWAKEQKVANAHLALFKSDFVAQPWMLASLIKQGKI